MGTFSCPNDNHLEEFSLGCIPKYSVLARLSTVRLLSFSYSQGGTKWQIFATSDELEKSILKYFVQLDMQKDSVGIRKLILRYEKCLNFYENYVKK